MILDQGCIHPLLLCFWLSVSRWMSLSWLSVQKFGIVVVTSHVQLVQGPLILLPPWIIIWSSAESNVSFTVFIFNHIPDLLLLHPCLIVLRLGLH